MKSLTRLLISGISIVVLLTVGYLGLDDLSSTQFTSDQISIDGETPGLVRSQAVIDAKIARKEMKLAGEKSDQPKNPGDRIKWETKMRAGPDGTIPQGALLRAKAQFDELERQYLAGPDKDGGIESWTWLGPGNVGGRIRAIAIHPTNPSTMWIGGVAGGIWRSTDTGANWSPMTDFLANLAVTFIVLDPTDSDVLYASTGEGFWNADGLQGAGIFRSNDAGVTWAQLAATDNNDFLWTNRLAHHPTNSGELLAATANGLFETTDSGATWTRILNTIGRTQDVRYHPTDPSLILVGTESNAYFSDDGGATFDRITDGTNSTLNSPGRCEVAFAPSDVDIFYLAVDINKGEIWRTTDGGANWTQRHTGSEYMSKQGWYDNAIWVRPDDPDFVIVGGIDLWRSTDGGASITRISDWHNYHITPFSAHADHHIVIPHPDFGTGGNLQVYFGNDGGIQTTGNIETVSQTAGWANLANNLGITQFYGGAAAPDGSVIIGGTQDNDHLRYRPGDGVHGWYQAETGDGGFAAINYNNTNVMYSEYVFLKIEKSTNGGDSYFDAITGLTDAESDATALFIAPFVMDPVDPDILYGGGASIWQTTDAAANWSEFKTPEAGNPLCSAIDVYPGDTDIIWVGYDTGVVMMTDDLGGGWTRVDNNGAGIPARYITDIAISPHNSDQVVVTTGGYRNDSVWYTDDGGASWTALVGTAPGEMPDIQVNTARFDVIMENWIYIGTDLGVLATEDLGQTWSVTALNGSNEGPVNTRVSELFWQGDKLIAATHGRGMYLTELFRNNPPVAICQNVEAEADQDCLGHVTPDMVDNGSYDPDGDDITLELDPAGPFPLGDTDVTLTVTDEHGASDDCTAVVTVIDVTPPLMTCPVDIEVECSVAGGVPSDDPQLVDFFAAFMVEDNCDPNPTVVNDAPALFAGPCEANGGVTSVTWTATDFSGNSASCASTVTVVDTTPPEIMVTVEPQVLWPPNHKMVEVEYTVTVSDICDDDPQWVLVSVVSNEPQDDNGDGNTEPDIQDADLGTPDTEVSLRAERDGRKTGRIYTATFEVTDCSGNSSQATCNVYVPHSQSDMASILASSGLGASGSSKVSFMVPGSSIWAGAIPVEIVGGSGGNDELRFIDPLSAVIINTAGFVVPTAFFVKDVDFDNRRDVLVEFDLSALEDLSARSDELDGVPVMALEIGHERFMIIDMTDIQETEYDLDGVIAELRLEGGDGDILVQGNTEAVADRVAGLIGAAPNPFNPSTKISYYIPDSRHVELAIFDISGRRVARLVSQTVSAGEHSVMWHGKNDVGGPVASGVYFYQLTAGSLVETKRMILIK